MAGLDALPQFTQGNKFADYNFREYAVRITKEDFRNNQNDTDGKAVEKNYQYGLDQLQLIRRQSTINQMYAQKMSFMDPRVSDDIRKKDEMSVGSRTNEEDDEH
ncbi:LYR motif-containing protein [Acrasis kona]|uniref:LYR motif-containing protein n=1 Tax=Acrasis kona TaxID=1008807 RepID=A0AAW2YII8_9EUKA